MKVISLNFETREVDVIDLPKHIKEDSIEIEEYLYETLNYSLSNCQWMVVHSSVKVNFIEE